MSIVNFLEQFGAIVLLGKKLQVPTNYDKNFRSDAGPSLVEGSCRIFQWLYFLHAVAGYFRLCLERQRPLKISYVMYHLIHITMCQLI